MRRSPAVLRQHIRCDQTPAIPHPGLLQARKGWRQTELGSGGGGGGAVAAASQWIWRRQLPLRGEVVRGAGKPPHHPLPVHQLQLPRTRSVILARVIVPLRMQGASLPHADAACQALDSTASWCRCIAGDTSR